MKTICDCGHIVKSDGIGTGYAIRVSDNKKLCYECASKEELQEMKEKGKATLYLSGNKENGWTVTNRTRILDFTCTHPKIGNHNMTGKRYDVWFSVPRDKFWWWGVRYGDNTEILHAKRTKELRG